MKEISFYGKTYIWIFDIYDFTEGWRASIYKIVLAIWFDTFSDCTRQRNAKEH